MPGAPPVPGYDSGAANPAAPGPQQTAGSGNTITVGSYQLSLNSGVNPDDLVKTKDSYATNRSGAGGHALSPDDQQYNAQAAGQRNEADSVANQLQGFNGWSLTQYQQFREQAWQMGLTTSKNAGKADVLVAWQTVVEEAAKEQVPITTIVDKATQAGWNSLNAQIQPADNGLPGSGDPGGVKSSITQVNQTSLMDPATAQGTLADAYQRLMGRNPTTKEYQAFLDSLYSYETNADTGTMTYKTSDGSGGASTSGGQAPSPTGGIMPTSTDETKVTQKGVGVRGAEFLAGQAAMQNPQEGAYQAATSYFNAFMKALSGPAAGMGAATPTNSAP